MSHQDPARVDPAVFQELHGVLADSFPRVHAELQRETLNDLSLLYTWPGRDLSLPPLLLLSHQDVVPVTPGTELDWTHPPFGGVVADGFIWGRGAIDNKASLIASLAAVEHLLAAGVTPPRTVLLAYGHDEEVGGGQGARAIADLLAERGVRPFLVLDEGSAITEGLVRFVTAPVALLGVAEKGLLSLELTVTHEGGHAAMPFGSTAIGRLARAVTRLEAAPFPAHLDGVMAHQLDTLGPEMPFTRRLILANRWLLGGLVKRLLAQKPTTDAATRTTLAVTMIAGGEKENVLPQRARAVANLRLLPGDTIAAAIARIRATIADDEVEVRPLGLHPREASRISDVDGAGFRTVSRVVRSLFPGTVVAPHLVLGASDAAHYEALAEHVIRFLPLRMRQSDLARVHGTDERLAVENLADIVRFYVRLIEVEEN